MQPYLKAYDKNGKLLATGHEVVGDRGSVIIPNLAPHTTYPEGSFFISWQAEQYETEKVAVPEFTTHESTYKEFAFYFKDHIVVKTKTAYDLAVDNGFTGTEEEWVQSIKGDALTYSGMTPTEKEEFNGNIVKELEDEIIDGIVREVMTDNAMGLLDDEYKEKINQDVINYIASNSEKYRGKDGEPLKYSDLTTQQKEELKSKITDQAVTDFVLEDGTITNAKIADASISNTKLSDNYASVKILEENDNVLELTREGTYLKISGKKLLGIPNELETGEKYTLLIIVRGYNANFRSIEIINTSDISKMYKNFMRLGTPIGWKIITEDESILNTVKDYSLNTVNDKLQYNAQVFEKYIDGLIPDLNLLASNAVQDIKIEGLDPELPLKLWVLSRNYANGSTAWNHRIVIGQKKDGVWSTVIDTGTNYSVSESDKGATKISYQKGAIKLTARINYGLLPQGGRILDHRAMSEDPYFIIRPKNVSLTDNTIPDVEVYDQSLNTTDSVRFASIKADSIEVGGELKTGTLETPPTGLVKGDMWLDITDSSEHPILRVMS